MCYSQDEKDFWNAYETIKAKEKAASHDPDAVRPAQLQFQAYRPRIVSREQVRIVA